MNQNDTHNADSNIAVDVTRQSGTEHNRNALAKNLHEDGWPEVVVRAVSEFTVFIHTRTLAPDEREQFREYALGQGWTELEDDMVGEIYRVNI